MEDVLSGIIGCLLKLRRWRTIFSIRWLKAFFHKFDDFLRTVKTNSIFRVLFTNDKSFKVSKADFLLTVIFAILL